MYIYIYIYICICIYIYSIKNVLLFCPYSREDLDLFFNYMNNNDSTKNIQFTIEVTQDILEFLDLRLKFDNESKHIFVDIFSKATSSFAYVLPSTYFPKINIENIRRICDSASKFEKRSTE